MTKKIKLSNSESNKVHHHHNHSHNHGEMCHGHGIIGIVDGVTGENIIQVNGENLRSVPNGHSLIHSINSIINSHSKHGIIKNILKDSTIITGTLSSKTERISAEKIEKINNKNNNSNSNSNNSNNNNEDNNNNNATTTTTTTTANSKQQQEKNERIEKEKLDKQQLQLLQQQLRNDSIFKNKLSNSLSRNIPTLSLLKENFKDEMENNFHSAISDIRDLREKVEMVNLIFTHSLADKSAMANVDSIIHSSTSGLLAQYKQITEKFDWDQSSLGYKNKGNELFQKKQYTNALLLYNEALRLYDIEDNKDTSILSSIHSNRCLCLVNLERYTEGAIEASRGIELVNSTAHLLHKLYYRRGICYYHQRKHFKARKDFLRAHKLIEKMDSSDIASIENYLYKIQKLSLPIQQDEEFDNSLATSSFSPLSTFNNSSLIDYSMVDFREMSLVDSRVKFTYQSDSVGRISEATDSIPSNTVLYQEQPYISCLDRKHHSNHCYNCFKEILSPIYCKGCSNSQYCSSKCLNEDYNKQHSRECGKGFLIICSHESLLAIRLLIRKGKEFRDRSDSKTIEEDDDDEEEDKEVEYDDEVNLQYIPSANKIQIDQNLKKKPTTPTSNSNNTSPIIQSQTTTTTNNSNNNSNNISEQLNNLQISQDDELYDEPNDPCYFGKSNSYRTSYDMINSFDPHYNQHSNENMANMIFDAFVIERFIRYYRKELGILKQDVNVNVILRHLCQLTTYTFAIPGYIDHLQDSLNQYQNTFGNGSNGNSPASLLNVQKYTQEKIGYAVFPMASLMNHSCDNNTQLQYDGSSLMVKSLVDIESGDEILGCYGPHAFSHPLNDRLVNLYKEYFFICRCSACSAKSGPDPIKCPGLSTYNNSDDDEYDDDSNVKPIVNECDGTLLESINVNQIIANSKLQQLIHPKQLVDKKKYQVSQRGDSLNIPYSKQHQYDHYDDYENRLFICNKCGIELTGLDSYSLTSQVIISDNLFEMGSSLLLDGNFTKEVEKMLLNSLEIRQSIFKPFSKKIGDVYDALSRYSIGRGNGRSAANYTEKLIDNIKTRLGHSNSEDLNQEILKLASIYKIFQLS